MNKFLSVFFGMIFLVLMSNLSFSSLPDPTGEFPTDGTHDTGLEIPLEALGDITGVSEEVTSEPENGHPPKIEVVSAVTPEPRPDSDTAQRSGEGVVTTPTATTAPLPRPAEVEEREAIIEGVGDAANRVRAKNVELNRLRQSIARTQNETRIAQLQAEIADLTAQRASVEAQASALMRQGFDAGTLSTSDIELLLLQLPDLDLNTRIELRDELSGRSSCNPDSWWSFVCNFFSENRAKDIEIRRLNARIQSETVDAQSANEYNTQVLSVLNDELAVWAPGINCGIDTSDCKEQLSNIACNDEECENQVRVAQSLIRQAEGSIRIPRSGMIRAAELLQVRDSSFALASQLQDWLGFEFSLISEGSGIDQILSWGTPEQVCLAKVDSFISVNGLQVEGQVFDEEDEFSGFTSRMRACDNRQFDICADLRAERSGVYFNNSISLVVHLMVKNSRDHDQEVVLNAEFFNDGVRESYNIFNFTDEVQGNSLILSPGQRRSFSLHLSEFQVFADQDISSLSGNVLLSVFRKVGEGGVVSDQNLDYAIDYPIMSMISGQSSSQSRREEALNSGAEFTEGTTQATPSLLQRVSID